MSNKDRNKDLRNQSRSRGKAQGSDQSNNKRDELNRSDDYRSTNLRDSQMMAHLMDAMEQGQDIGHFGRLTFAMVGQYFLSDEEILELFNKQPDFDEKEAKVMLMQVRERGYNPPKRERILQWMEKQDFPICPNPEDPGGCNVYRELQFPDKVYGQIEDFWEERVDAQKDKDQ